MTHVNLIKQVLSLISKHFYFYHIKYLLLANGTVAILLLLNAFTIFFFLTNKNLQTKMATIRIIITLYSFNNNLNSFLMFLLLFTNKMYTTLKISWQVKKSQLLQPGSL